MNVLSLFAGIGGLELGLERAGMTVVGQVEIDPFCQRVLAKHWPEVPRHDDVRTAIDWWRGQQRPPVHVVAGGFPCQPVSFAGRGLGEADERWGWPWMLDVVRALRPGYLVMENVAALVARGLPGVAADLAQIGYDLEWDCVPASAVGAPHRRDRWWGVAYPHRQQLWLEPVAELGRCGAPVAGGDGQDWPVADAQGLGRGQGWAGGPVGARADGSPVGSQALADTDRLGRLGRTGIEREDGRAESADRRVNVADTDGEGRGAGSWLGWPRPTSVGDRWWAAEPDVGRVAHGIPGRVDRLRALGNAVVPQVAEHVGRLIVNDAELTNA